MSECADEEGGGVLFEFCIRTKFLGGKIIISMGKSVFNF